MASAVGVMHAAQAIADRQPDGTLATARTAGTLDVHHVIERGLAGEAESSRRWRWWGGTWAWVSPTTSTSSIPRLWWLAAASPPRES